MTRKHDQFISDTNTDYLNTRIDELEAELATVKESLTTAEATIDKMHNEECPHTVSALAAGGGK